MAQINYRANLLGRYFPFLESFAPRTVIVPGNDQVYPRYPASSLPVKQVADLETPEILYMQNVLPIMEGYTTVRMSLSGTDGFSLLLGRVVRKVISVTDAITVGGSNIAQLAELNTGEFVLLNEFTGGITADCVGDSCSGYRQDAITYATVNGRTYALMRDSITPANTVYSTYTAPITWTNIVPTGLTLVDVIGIVAAAGYVVAYTETEVAWCAVSDPTDFVPSLITGAGGGAVEEIKGRILFCKQSSFGFIIYATGNCVAAVATGNSRYPFKFAEIKNAGAGISPELVAADANSISQIAYTSFGLQELTQTQAQIYLPELNDFIRKGYNSFVDITGYNPLTETATNITLSARKNISSGKTLLGKLTTINSRFLCYSYVDVNESAFAVDVGNLTDILVYDLVYERWGKIKYTHIDCIQRTFDAFGDIQTSPSELSNIGYHQDNSLFPIALASREGNYYHLQSGLNEDVTSNSVSLILLGKYQYVRSRRLVVDKIWAESNVIQTGLQVFSAFVIPSYDGANRQAPVFGYTDINTDTLKTFLVNIEGYNHILGFLGNFTLSSVQLDFHVGGKQ